MKSEFLLAFNEICESRGLSKEVVLEAIETALVSAFRRNIGVSNAQMIDAKIDPATGAARIYAEKEVVESVQDERTEVLLKQVRRLGHDSVALGDMVMVDSTPEDFGRIAAQTAKQVILQRIREAEREQLFEDFSGREGEIVNGTVQSVTPQGVTLGLGRTEALLPRNQMVPGERYHPHDKVRAYVLEVRRSSRGPQIIVSRSHRNMLRRMLELEVPEIYNGLVEIKSVAREAGQRSKVAVAALQDGVDPVGACVGMRGVRIQSIVRELNDEKIDVIEWSPDPRVFIAKALSPARVSHVYLHPDATSGKTATVIVPDDQLSLAIGREGQNARLAAKLTGWRIDIKSLTEAVTEALGKKEDPLVAVHVKRETVLLEQASIILAKKQADRPITAEDFQTLGRIVDLIEGRFAERAEEERRAEDAVRKTIGPLFWQMPLTLLELDEPLLETLTQRGFESVGHIMALLAFKPEELQRRAELDDAATALVQERMAVTEFPQTAEELAVLIGGEVAVAETEGEPIAEVVEPVTEPGAAVPVMAAEEQAPSPVEEAVEPAEELVALYEEPPEEIRIPVEEPAPEQPLIVRPIPKPTKPAKPGAVITPARREEDEVVPAPAKKKGKKKRRPIVFDEQAGKGIVRHKGRLGFGEVEDWEEL